MHIATTHLGTDRHQPNQGSKRQPKRQWGKNITLICDKLPIREQQNLVSFAPSYVRLSITNSKFHVVTTTTFPSINTIDNFDIEKEGKNFVQSVSWIQQ